MDFKDISEEAGMLLINIIEHEKESNYWPERFSYLSIINL